MNYIFEYIVYGVIMAWILSWFNLDDLLIEVLQPFLKFDINGSTYYVFFIVVGFLLGVIEAIKS